MKTTSALCCICILLLTTLAYAQSTSDFDPAPMRKQAAQLLEQGRLLESVDLYHQIASQSDDPKERASALVRAADMLALFLDNAPLAQEFYEQAMALSPRGNALENAYFNSGMLFFEEGAYIKAEERFTQFLSLFPHSGRSDTAVYMLERARAEAKAGALPHPAPTPTPAPPVLGPEPIVRVLLERTQGAVAVRFPYGAKLEGGAALAPGNYVFSAASDGVVFDNTTMGRRIVLTPVEGDFEVNEVVYPGRLVLQEEKGRLLVINQTPLDRYLPGVVAGEMPLSFHPEALKAQAVAARSYALYLMSKNKNRAYDLSAGSGAQVYTGSGAGAVRALRAVEETRGESLLYNGAPILAYYHSHSGGMLEDDANVWTGDFPYFQVQEDMISNRVKPMVWSYRATRTQLAQALRKSGFSVGEVTGLSVAEKSLSGRVVRFRVQTPTRSVLVKADTLRRALGASKMKSTLCTVRKEGGAFVFEGRGYGHGVGMSQWGAEGMARNGASYTNILKKYYPGCSLKGMY